MKKFKQKIKSEEGQGLVEFALILLLFLSLVLGMLEYGWLLNAKITVNSAAKDAARTRIVVGGEESDAVEIVNEILGGTRGKEYTMVISNMSDPSNPTKPLASGDPVKVVITYHAKPLVGYYEKSKTVPIVGEATMRME